MKKAAIALIMAFIVLLSQHVSAHAKSISASLSITENIAFCEVVIEAPEQEICATLELWCGKDRLAVWNMKGDSSLTLEKRSEVKSGRSYSVTVKGTIGGNQFEPVTVVQTS